MSKDLKISLTLDAKTGKLKGQLKGVSNDLLKVGQSGGKAGNQVNVGMSKGSKGVKDISRQLDGAKTAMLGFIGAASLSQVVGGVVRTADAYKSMQSQIRLVTNSQQELLAAQNDLHILSINTRSDLLVNTKLYSALTPTFQELGRTQKDATKIITLYNKALATTNPTAQEARSATLQFTQAMGSGVLRGEEFNSIMENGRGVAMALAAGLDVPVGALRGMAEQGALTADVVIAALEKQEQSINKNYANIEMTVSQAWQNMTTEMGFYIGENEKVNALTGTLTSSIENLSLNLDAAGNALTITVGAFTAYRAGALLATASTKGLTTALGALAKNPWVLAITTLASAYYLLSSSTDEQKAKLKDKRSEEEKHLELLRKKIALKAEEMQGSTGTKLIAQRKQLNQLTQEYAQWIEYAQAAEAKTAANDLIKKQEDARKQANADYLIGLETIKDAENKAFFDNVERKNQLAFIKSQKLSEYRAMLDEQWNAEDTQAVKFDQLTGARALSDEIDNLNIKVKDYGDTWARTGNQIIDSMQSVASVLEEANAKDTEYATKQAEINDLKAKALKDFGAKSTDYAKANKKLTKDQIKLDDLKTKNSLKGSLAMLDASVGMYTEGSKAQKIAQDASLVIHTAKLAMNIAEAISAATVATAESAKGDPYTAWARIGAMSVMMGGLLSQIGASFGGASGSSPDLSVAAQKNQGTGTILGDASAKSDSLKNTFDLLNDINVNQYAELQQINLGIKLMNGSLEGVSSSLIRSGLGRFGGESFNLDLRSIASNNAFAQLPSFLGDWGSSIAGGKRSNSVTDGGVDFGAQSLGSLINGADLNGDAYSTVKTVKDGGWFYSDSTSYKTYTKGLDDQTKGLMGDVFAGLGESMLGVADDLGLNYANSIKNYVIDLPQISLKGMSNDEVNTTLQNMVSEQADLMAADLFGGVAAMYQKAGEGLFETLSRITIEKAVVNDELSAAFVTLGTDTLATTQTLVNLAGGLSDFTDNAKDYYDAFFTEQEKSFRNQQNITKQLAKQNIALPKTRDAYRDLVEALDINTEKGQEQYTVLMSLADAADEFYSAIDDLTDSLINHYNKIIGTVSSANPLSLINAQTTISDAIAQAQAGNLPTLESVSDALNVLSNNDNSGYSTLNDFKREQLINANLIDDLTLAVSDKTIEEHMLDALNAQNETLLNIDNNTLASAVNSLNNPDKVYDNGSFDLAEWNANNPDNQRAFRGASVFNVANPPSYNKNFLIDALGRIEEQVKAQRIENAEAQEAIAQNTYFSAKTLERLDDDGIASRV